MNTHNIKPQQIIWTKEVLGHNEKNIAVKRALSIVTDYHNNINNIFIRKVKGDRTFTIWNATTIVAGLKKQESIEVSSLKKAKEIVENIINGIPYEVPFTFYRKKGFQDKLEWYHNAPIRSYIQKMGPKEYRVTMMKPTPHRVTVTRLKDAKQMILNQLESYKS